MQWWCCPTSSSSSPHQCSGQKQKSAQWEASSPGDCRADQELGCSLALIHFPSVCLSICLSVCLSACLDQNLQRCWSTWTMHRRNSGLCSTTAPRINRYQNANELNRKSTSTAWILRLPSTTATIWFGNIRITRGEDAPCFRRIITFWKRLN